ncbi:hypothetical protein ACFWN2_16780 [Lentzea sp. NPDC058436]
MTISARWEAFLRHERLPAVLTAAGLAALAAVVTLASVAVVVAVVPE